MGARYLKTEEAIIRDEYPTAPRYKMHALIPDRTWEQIGVHARKMSIYRTSKTKGNSIREGRKILKHSWSYKDNFLFDRMYPNETHAQLLATFPARTWLSIRSHAQRRHIYRTHEATGRQINIGRENARKEEAERKWY